MENQFNQNGEEEKKMKYLKEKREQNLQIIQSRLHDLEIEKQKRQRDKQR